MLEWKLFDFNKPAAKHVVKYENYTYKNPSRIPEMTTYICERCNTHFNKQSSLINHNKRFHAAFDETEKGKKREETRKLHTVWEKKQKWIIKREREFKTQHLIKDF